MKQALLANRIFSISFCLFCIVFQSHAQTFDTSFGTKGLFQSSNSTDEKYVKALAEQSDGKIVLINSFYTSGTANIIRVTQSGIADVSFGIDGVVPIQYPAGNTVAYGDVDIKVGANNFIYASTRVYVADSGFASIISCYNPNGTLNTAFGNGGFAKVQMDFGAKLAVDTLGRIYAGASNVFARLLSNGTPDVTFGVNGLTIQPIANAYLLKALPGGKLLVYGTNYVNGVGVVRLKVNGSPDSTFGTNGRISLQPASNPQGFVEQAVDMIVKNNKNILVQCLRHNSTKNYNSVYQLTFNGQLDPTFGVAGNYLSTTVQYPKCINEVANKQFITTGNYKTMGVNYIVFTRFNANASIDSTYGVNGVLTYSQKDLGINNFNIVSHEPGSNRMLYFGGDNYTLGSYALSVVRFNYLQAPATLTASAKGTIVMPALQSKTVIQVYPNPAIDNIIVQGLSASPAAELRIVNTEGKQQGETVKTNNIQYSWNVSKLSPGTYFIEVMQNNKITSLKFIKL